MSFFFRLHLHVMPILFATANLFEGEGQRVYLAYNEVNGMLVVARPYSSRAGDDSRSSDAAHIQVQSSEGKFVIEAEYPLPRPPNVRFWSTKPSRAWPDVVAIVSIGMHMFQKPRAIPKAKRTTLRGRHIAFQGSNVRTPLAL